MRFREIIKSYDWSSVETTLLRLYPDQKDTIDGHRSVFDCLQIIQSEKDDTLIVLTECPTDTDDKTEPKSTYVAVSGREQVPNSAGITESCALEFTRWEKWLGMNLAPETTKNFNDLEIIAHCLFEMTFYGYNQNEIQKQLDSIGKE